MHQTLAILCFLGTFVLIQENQKVVAASAIGKYTTKYDTIDVDSILNNKRLLNNYVNCLLEKGPCTPEGKELKTYLPDALATECSKCSDWQKKQGGKILAHLLQYHRNYWDALIAKYDPQGNFAKKHGFEDDSNEEDDDEE